MIEDLATGPFWLAIGKIVWINVLLSGDNAVVIAMAARELAAERQRQAIILGSLLAIALRIILIFFAVYLLDLPYVKLIGSALLVWIGIQLLKGNDHEASIDPAKNLVAAIRTILVADLVMSLDNVIALAAVADSAPQNSRLVVLIIGLGLTIPLIMFGSTILLKVMQRFPVITIVGGALLGYVAGEMAAGDPVLLRFGTNDAWKPYALGGVFAIIVVLFGTVATRRRA